MAGRVLIVATSHDKLGETGQPTGCWVEEVASPYYAWRSKGYQVTIASIKGGEIPFDPASKAGDFCTPEATNFLNDKEAQEKVNNSKPAADMLGSVEEFDAIFLPGGHGIVYDGPKSKELKELLEKFWAAGKVVSAVCHGPAGLVTACAADGNSIVKGKQVTGFTNTEEIAVNKQDAVPFLLEDKLKELGGLYERSEGDWASFVVSDGQLITGQNPGSSKAVAEAVIEAVSPGLSGPVHGKTEGEGFHKRE